MREILRGIYERIALCVGLIVIILVVAFKVVTGVQDPTEECDKQ